MNSNPILPRILSIATAAAAAVGAALLSPVISPTPARAQAPAVSLDDLPDARARAEAPGAVVRAEPFGLLRSGWAVAVDPGQVFEFEWADPPEGAAWPPETPEAGAVEWTERAQWSLPGGALSRSAAGRWRVRSPKSPGASTLTVAAQGSLAGAAGPRREFRLALLVKAAFDPAGNGAIAGYPVGVYPGAEAADAPSFVAAHKELYAPPAALIPVTPETEGMKVSAHYRLRDFAPRAERGKACWIALDPRLLDFLEAATGELVAAAGANKPKSACPLAVLVGYLSPNLLAQLKAKGSPYPQYTRFQYGDGATVIWDADGDGVMEDLNHDGKIDLADAAELADRLADIQKKLGKFGGVGASGGPKLPGLKATPVVDVDLRGVASRW